MPGAAQKRAKKERQGGAGGEKKAPAGPSDQKTPEQNSPAGYDGPAERPGSASGPPQQGSSRGRAPSNAQSYAPSQSTRGSSRPPSAGGPPPSEQPFGAKKEEKYLNKRIEWGGNAHGFYNNDEEVSRLHEETVFRP